MVAEVSIKPMTVAGSRLIDEEDDDDASDPPSFI